MIIQPIVEGQGEVDAIPTMLRRICYELGCCVTARIAPPIRVSRSKLILETELRRYSRIASLYPGCGLVLLFMDADDDCARELCQLIKPWMDSECRDIPSELIVIPREYEAWIIAALESLRGLRGITATADSCDDPEHVRDAKGYISRHMVGSSRYHETSDQSALTALVDLEKIRQCCPSFRRLLAKIESHCANAVIPRCE